MKYTVAAVMALCVSNGMAVLQNKPAGPGQPESNMGAACDECAKHAEYLDKGGDDCVCHATDIMGTFANDATKEQTNRAGMGSKTANTGVERLPEGWMWHCRPVT